MFAARSNPRRSRSKGWSRWLWPAVIGLAVGVLAGSDYLVGMYQNHQIELKRAHRKKLERMAWFHIRADFEKVQYTEDNRYRVTAWIENAFPEHPAYVMMPSIRAYIQVGPQWKEVPGVEPQDSKWGEGTVIKLDGRVVAERIFDIREKDFFELLAGYMHIRLDNVMYIADEAEPKDDVVERASLYYIHLRPIGADDEKLKAKHNFATDVPVYISMPPH